MISKSKIELESLRERLLAPLPDWLAWAGQYWHEAGEDEEGYFGTGTEEILAHSAVIGYLAACVATAEGWIPNGSDSSDYRVGPDCDSTELAEVQSGRKATSCSGENGGTGLSRPTSGNAKKLNVLDKLPKRMLNATIGAERCCSAPPG